jgi:hypothetical protein
MAKIVGCALAQKHRDRVRLKFAAKRLPGWHPDWFAEDLRFGDRLPAPRNRLYFCAWTKRRWQCGIWAGRVASSLCGGLGLNDIQAWIV